MNKFRRFFIDYLMVPLGIPVACALLAGYHVSRELDANGYATLAEAWPHLHQPARDAITEAMKKGDGKISQWDYSPLFSLALNDAGALTMSGNSGNVDQERVKLAGLMMPATAKGSGMTIGKGQSFACAPFIKPSWLMQQRDDTPAQCAVTGDVRPIGSATVVIPKGSRLFGWKKDGRIEWTAWTTPGGIAIGDKALHGVAFASRIDPADDDSLTVTALHDIAVPALAVSSN